MIEPRSETDAVFCDECNAAVRLERHAQTDDLRVRCACDEQRSIKVATILPDGWQP